MLVFGDGGVGVGIGVIQCIWRGLVSIVMNLDLQV